MLLKKGRPAIDGKSSGDLVMEVVEERFKDSRFKFADLLVACWKKYPLRFGLKTFEQQYPDSNRLIVTLCGANGLIHRKLLQRVKPGVLQKSEAGARS